MKAFVLKVVFVLGSVLVASGAMAETAACNIYEYPQLFVTYPSYLHIRNDSAANRSACLNDIYQSVLNRAADASGLSYYGSLLQSSIIVTYRPSSIRQQIANSAEAGALINSAYLRYLGRNADAGGLAYWRSILAIYGYNTVVAGIAGSPERASRLVM